MIRKRHIVYMSLYVLEVAVYFLNACLYPRIKFSLMLSTSDFNLAPQILYSYGVSVAITASALVRANLNAGLENRKAALTINVCCIAVSSAICCFSSIRDVFYLVKPNFLTFIWVADAVNLVVSIVRFVRRGKAGADILTD